MDDYVKLDIARDILNFMIAHYSKDSYNPENKFLQQLLSDEKLFRKNDPATIEKIFNIYGPMVRGFK